MCFEDDDDQYKHFDICKSYPNVLINNTEPIPLCSIHDETEVFGGLDDLEQTGEFYIDEVVLDKKGCDLKKEAGFYSKNLVKYLVQVLNMDLSTIKYMIVTNRALKPDTFKSFTEYIFDNFEQKTARILANSFIGSCGRKYSKINHGFTCRDYETAMNVWTPGVNEKMNITVDDYNNLYLIKEQKIE